MRRRCVGSASGWGCGLRRRRRRCPAQLLHRRAAALHSRAAHRAQDRSRPDVAASVIRNRHSCAGSAAFASASASSVSSLPFARPPHGPNPVTSTTGTPGTGEVARAAGSVAAVVSQHQPGSPRQFAPPHEHRVAARALVENGRAPIRLVPASRPAPAIRASRGRGQSQRAPPPAA